MGLNLYFYSIAFGWKFVYQQQKKFLRKSLNPAHDEGRFHAAILPRDSGLYIDHRQVDSVDWILGVNSIKLLQLAIDSSWQLKQQLYTL